MTTHQSHLPTDAKALQEMVLSLQSQVKNLMAEKQLLIEQFRLAQQQRFGASSEANPAQGDLFNEAEVTLDDILVVCQGKGKSICSEYGKELKKQLMLM